jgi:regulator of sigma E protease
VLIEQYIQIFGNFWYAVAAFAVAISVIVAVHEYGHYIVGRWCGIHADVFSLGFGPTLFSRVDRHGTRWQLAAIPLGGYVKFKGDANASSVGGTEGGRDTMLGAPVWARALTVLAGPVFNFILSIVIFAGIALYVGVARDPLTIKEVPPLPPVYQQELLVGDVLVSIGGLPVETGEKLSDAIDQLPLQPVLDYVVLRNGVQTTVKGPFPQTTEVVAITPKSAAEEAGLVEGDYITAINGSPTFAFSQMIEIVSGSGGAPLLLDVWNAETGDRQVTLAAQRRDLPAEGGGFETRWLMGVSGGISIVPETESIGVIGALQSGISRLWMVLTLSLSSLYHMAFGWISLCNLSSPVGIAQAAAAAASAGLMDFIGIIGFISAAVGFLNLLPIPVLDGGHLVFHAYEAVTRKRPSDGALRLLIGVGLALILSMLAVGLLNDIFLCY